MHARAAAWRDDSCGRLWTIEKDISNQLHSLTTIPGIGMPSEEPVLPKLITLSSLLEITFDRILCILRFGGSATGAASGAFFDFGGIKLDLECRNKTAVSG